MTDLIEKVEDEYGLVESAKRGAEVLDRIDPEWYEKINTGRLDMSLYSSCILGQLYGNDFNGGAILGFALPTYPGPTFDPEREALWNQLTDAWINEIESRR